MDCLLDVQGLEVVYHTQTGPLKALHDVNVSVRPGEIVGVVGESGCGKSTIASALLRLLPSNGEITAGRMLFKGKDLRSLDAEALRGLRGDDIAMIFQDPMTSLNPAFTIETQMVDVQKYHQTGQPAATPQLRRTAIEMLGQTGIPDPDQRIKRYPHQFSGGLRQRIMIAMALISEPGLLIADEPTSALDVTLEAQILELIKQLREKHGTSILFISHDLGVIAQLCDRVVVMYAGRTVEQGDVYSLFGSPKHPYTRALLASVPSRLHQGQRLATIPGRVPSLSMLPPGCKFVDRCALARSICHQLEPAELPVDGHQVRCHIYNSESGYGQEPALAAAPVTEIEIDALPTPPAPKDGPSDPVLLRLRNLSTNFYEPRSTIDTLLRRQRKAVHAVDGVDLDIMRGEVIGLVGESGCGKTTLGKTILRLIQPTAGQIIFDGADITHASIATLQGLRGRMQMIFQDPCSSLSPRLPVSYLLTEPYRIHHTPPEERYDVTQLLAMVGLSDEQATKYAHQMSGGQARRVGIARALALHPEFLIADEPTSGLDVSVGASIMNLMKDVGKRLGLTYLIITHNLNVVGYIADRTAVMYLGRMVEVGRTNGIFSAPCHPYTLALLSAISEPDPRLRTGNRRLLLSDEIPSPQDLPPGCRFHPRCAFAESRCRQDAPGLAEVEPGHYVACHFWHRAREQAFTTRRPLNG